MPSKSGYHKNWVKISRRIRDRDDFTCKLCGCCARTRVLHVHHIDWDTRNNSSLNLVTVCTSCHNGIHAEHYRPSEHWDWPAPWGELESLDDDPDYIELALYS